MGAKKEEKAKPQKAIKTDHATRHPKRPGTVKVRSGCGKATDFFMAQNRRASRSGEAQYTEAMIRREGRERAAEPKPLKDIA